MPAGGLKNPIPTICSCMIFECKSTLTRCVCVCVCWSLVCPDRFTALFQCSSSNSQAPRQRFLSFSLQTNWKAGVVQRMGFRLVFQEGIFRTIFNCPWPQQQQQKKQFFSFSRRKHIYMWPGKWTGRSHAIVSSLATFACCAIKAKVEDDSKTSDSSASENLTSACCF